MSAIERREQASSELAIRRPADTATRPPTGLLLSIGDKTLSRGGREIPTRIDHFRPKDGELDQYAAAAKKFAEIYGDEPKQLDDLYFLSNDPAAVLEIRLMAWGKSGMRIRGATNYAELPRDEWEKAAFAFDDTVTFFPLNADEVPAKFRDKWKGQPIAGSKLSGPDDPRVKKYEVNVEARLTFLLPKVMGIGTVAQITTKSKKSMRNLHSSVWDQFEFFQGNLVGPPFQLSVRPAKTSRFDDEKKAMVRVDFFELVLDSTLTVQEVMDIVKQRSEVLTSPAVQASLLRGSAEARAFGQALQLPVASGEEQQLRDEPEAELLDDALLNRIAALEEQLGGPGSVQVTLEGVFGVEVATALTPTAALQYEGMLQRAVEKLVEDGGEAEIVIDPADDIPWPDEDVPA
jgi:hypothetical protein